MSRPHPRQHSLQGFLSSCLLSKDMRCGSVSVPEQCASRERRLGLWACLGWTGPCGPQRLDLEWPAHTPPAHRCPGPWLVGQERWGFTQARAGCTPGKKTAPHGFEDFLPRCTALMWGPAVWCCAGPAALCSSVLWSVLLPMLFVPCWGALSAVKMTEGISRQDLCLLWGPWRVPGTSSCPPGWCCVRGCTGA